MINQDFVLKTCGEARDVLLPSTILKFLPEIQSRLQKSIADYIDVFEKAAKGNLMDQGLLHEAVDQTMWLTSTEMLPVLQNQYPSEWKGLQALKPVANRFLDYN